MDDHQDTSYVLNIPFKFGCGRCFTSLVNADLDVKTLHSVPRIDQPPSFHPISSVVLPGAPMASIATAAQFAFSAINSSGPVSSLAPTNPLPVEPHSCSICGTC